MADPSALLFPGQGAQSVGMGRELAANLPAARELFARAAEVLGYDLLKLCCEGPAAELDSTNRSQPALYVCSLAALEQLKAEQPEVIASCTATAGLSLGEYTALAFAGALTFEDGLKLVAERGAAMQAAAEAAPSGMVSVLGLEVPQIETLCDEARQGEVLQIANLLCPGNTVCSGSKSACERLTAAAEAAGAMRVIPLAVAGAFHTSLMAPASDRLRAKLAATPLSAPRIPVVSNVDAQPHTDPAEIRELLVKQLVSPVLWERCVRTLHGELGIKTFYEVGPGKVLKGLMKRIDRSINCENVTA